MEPKQKKESEESDNSHPSSGSGCTRGGSLDSPTLPRAPTPEACDAQTPVPSSALIASSSSSTSGSFSNRSTSCSSLISPLTLSQLTPNSGPELATADADPGRPRDSAQPQAESLERQSAPPSLDVPRHVPQIDASQNDSRRPEGQRASTLPSRPGRRPIPSSLSPASGPVDHPSQPNPSVLDAALRRATGRSPRAPGPLDTPPVRPGPRGVPRALPPRQLLEPVNHPSQPRQEDSDRLASRGLGEEQNESGWFAPRQLSFLSMETDEEAASTPTTAERLSGGPPPNLPPTLRRASPPGHGRPFFCASGIPSEPMRARLRGGPSVRETITSTNPQNQGGPSSSASTAAAGSSMPPPLPETGMRAALRRPARPDYVVGSTSPSSASVSGESSVSAVFSEDINDPDRPVSPMTPP
ncbi:hypothetical protein BT67DRAFT_443161 [Trichocladium antarcticum]|uniref:Uncharacterized protein n=1 Tax=Trichocladium antarcticum TaxID=1450529 RepID=A0AAN6UI94_9PEZI|nr:hypothetical protein BT67DRAFT_443161 [Trichocladium antarcticum]